MYPKGPKGSHTVHDLVIASYILDLSRGLIQSIAQPEQLRLSDAEFEISSCDARSGFLEFTAAALALASRETPAN